MPVPGWLRLRPAIAAAVLLVVAALIAGTAPLPAGAREGGTQLVVPYRGQLDGSLYAGSNCGPAALAMVLAGYGRDVSVADIRATVNDLQRTWGDPDAGTAIENLAVIARQHGLEPLDLAAGGRLRRWTLDDLRAHLDAGHPIVPQVWYRGLPGRERRAYNGDHYIVLVGYSGDEFIYHDPVDLDGIGPGARISAEQLEIAWRESDLPFAALAFAGPPERPVLQPPPTATPSPTATPPPTAKPPPTVTPSPSPTAAPSPTATAEPTASPTPAPVLALAGFGGPSTTAARPPHPLPALSFPQGPAVPLALVLLAAHLALVTGRWPPARAAAGAVLAHPAVRVVGALLSLAALRGL